MNYLLFACALGLGVSFAATAAPPSEASLSTITASEEAQWDVKRNLHACSHLLYRGRAACLAGVSGHPALATAAEAKSAGDPPQSRATFDAERFEHHYRNAVEPCDAPHDSARDECAGVTGKHSPTP